MIAFDVPGYLVLGVWGAILGFCVGWMAGRVTR